MNLRKDNHGKNLKAWKALGPAKICHPLRYIRFKDSFSTTDEKGVRHIHEGPAIKMADIFASHGNGAAVRDIARTIAADDAAYMKRHVMGGD